jgi:ASC-1-like (ASCH) protein
MREHKMNLDNIYFKLIKSGKKYMKLEFMMKKEEKYNF